MGYAVDDTVDLPSGYLPGRIANHDQWHWPQPCTADTPNSWHSCPAWPASWGPPFRHCDGARRCFDQGSFVDIEFHRGQNVVGLTR